MWFCGWAYKSNYDNEVPILPDTTEKLRILAYLKPITEKKKN